MNTPNPGRAHPDEQARTFFDGLWRQGDLWSLDSSPFEQAKYARQIALLGDRRYHRVLEVGCGAGAFTRLLGSLSDYVMALDISAVAIERARAAAANDVLDFRTANIMEDELEKDGPWDLVVICETIYYMGWLYPFFDIAWLACRLFAAVGEGGRLLMANTLGETTGYLLKPPVIRTSRDLFVNAGFRIEHEEVFQGTKEGIPIETLISVFERPSQR